MPLRITTKYHSVEGIKRRTSQRRKFVKSIISRYGYFESLCMGKSIRSHSRIKIVMHEGVDVWRKIVKISSGARGPYIT